jgi:integrase
MIMSLEQALANGIGKVKGVKSAGVRAGNWLTKQQAQKLLDLPDVMTVKGLRDRAILAVMLGCGLRRSEVASLTYHHIARRDGRWVIVDLVGTGKHTRTVPMPTWAKAALDAWTDAASAAEGYLDAPNTGRVCRSIRRGGHLDGASMTDQAIADVARTYGDALGVKLAAHDPAPHVRQVGPSRRRPAGSNQLEPGPCVNQNDRALPGHRARPGRRTVRPPGPTAAIGVRSHDRATIRA